MLPGLSVVEGGQTSTGSVINWLKRLLGPAGGSYEQLNEEAAALPPGSEGLTCLDHFQGNRTPHTDPLSRGAITGGRGGAVFEQYHFQGNRTPHTDPLSRGAITGDGALCFSGYHRIMHEQ